MPEKSVREMNERERKHFSLAARVFHSALMSSAVLGLVALAIGLGLYTNALVGQYIGEAFGLSRSTAAVVEQVIDTQGLAGGVMEIYHSLSAEERAQPRSDDYRAHFAAVTEQEDYWVLRAILKEFNSSSDVNDIYFAVYDEETGAIVYVTDPDERPGHVCEPGDWEEVDAEEIEHFLNWDGEGQLYYIGKRDNYAWLCTAGVPLFRGEGETPCFILADISLKEVAGGMRSFVIQYAIATSLVTLIVAYFLTQHMKKALVAPINAIADAAQRYVRDTRAGERPEDHFSMLNIRTGDEVENLGLVMADMERDLVEHEENLTRITAEKERIGTELSLATRIQADMLPNIFPAFPDREEFDIYASMHPAKEVGGDFYDFFLIDDDHLCMVMADVSGKGVPAALFMMASKIMLANSAMMGKSPAEILRSTNDAICANKHEEMFVTVWLGILEISTGRLRAANAGHEYPVLKQPDGVFELVKDQHGFVIGGMDGVRYQDYELQLRPGAKLFVYTDGVPEATDAKSEMFGIKRMLATLNADPDAAPENILKNIEAAVNGFESESEQFDDLTMLCMEYRGGHAAAGAEEHPESPDRERE